MKIKKLVNVGSALLLSLSALLTVSIPLAHAATLNCSWTDASGTDNNFSTAGNWTSCGGTAPGAVGGNVYNLIFSSGASGTDPVLDIASLAIGTITFSGGGYDITSSSLSNTITISGGITDTSTGPVNEIDSNLTLGADQTFSAGATSQLELGDGTGTINIGSHNLTLGNALITNPIVGSGNLVISDSNYPADGVGVGLENANPGFTGNVSVNQGALFADDNGSLTAAGTTTVASGALLGGFGGVSSAVIQSGGTLTTGSSPSCLKASNATINGTYKARIGGSTNACSDYDQLQVSGNVDLTGSTLQLSLVNGFTPTVGQSFEIVNKSSGGAITGTFSGLAEGATFTSGGYTFQVSYKGGDGNDVTLTVVNISSSQAAAAAAAAAPKTPDTGLAAITGRPMAVFGVTTVAAFSLLVLARRFNLKSARH